MKQRAIIAMALACNPDLIIADEPTTALDVIVQHQILEETKSLQQDLGISILFISHDISIVADVCHDIGVMYAGQLVECGSREEVFGNPMHFYTRALLASYPTITGEKRDLRPHSRRDPEPGQSARRLPVLRAVRGLGLGVPHGGAGVARDLSHAPGALRPVHVPIRRAVTPLNPIHRDRQGPCKRTNRPF